MAVTTAAQLSATVRAARRDAGLSQQGLADLAGVSRSWLARFEVGHPAASIEQVLMVLRALGLGLDVVEPELQARDEEIRGLFLRERARRLDPSDRDRDL